MYKKYLLGISPEKFFLGFALVLGLSFLFVTPPLQVPDEPAHFLRAWQISEGQFRAIKKDGRVGGEVPLSLEKFCHPFWLSIFPGTPINADTLRHVARIELRPDVKKFKDFNNTALYAPLCYAPQAIAIFLLRIFETNPFYIFYFARVFTFITWLVIVFYAIRHMPFHKWLMVLLALLPMSLYVNMSLSADVMTNAICFLFISLVLKYAFDRRIVDRKRIAVLVLLSVLVVSVKNIYMSLVLLVLLIPAWKYEGRQNYLVALVLIFISAVTVALLWSRQLQAVYITYENYNPAVRDDLSLAPGADIAAQAQHIRQHAGAFKGTLLRSFGETFKMYAPGFIGIFGWLRVPLPFPVVLAGYLILILAACSAERASRDMRLRARLLLFSAFALTFVLVFVSQHLLWDPVGSALISNIQGRYLIPFMPLLLVAAGGRFFPRTWLPPVIAVYVIWAAATAMVAIYAKFYA